MESLQRWSGPCLHDQGGIIERRLRPSSLEQSLEHCHHLTARPNCRNHVQLTSGYVEESAEELRASSEVRKKVRIPPYLHCNVKSKRSEEQES
jgi:hypothetical protein